MITKKCSRCNEIKSVDSFYKNKAQACGVSCWCKVCAEYYKRISGQRSTNAKRQRDKAREEAFLAYGGYRCVCCGETEPLFLTLDHINNDGANHRKTIGNINLYMWLRSNHYPGGFQVLCMNCNLGKSRNKGICPHKMSGVLHE